MSMCTKSPQPTSASSSSIEKAAPAAEAAAGVGAHDTPPPRLAAGFARFFSQRTGLASSSGSTSWPSRRHCSAVWMGTRSERRQYGSPLGGVEVGGGGLPWREGVWWPGGRN